MKRRTMLHSGLSAHRPRRYVRPEAAVPEDLTTVDDLLDWVGEDQDRAKAVLAQEEAKGDDARVTLVTPLTALTNPGVTVPEGDLDSRVAWVDEADDSDDREARAQAVYQHEEDAGDTDLDALKAALWPQAPDGSGEPGDGDDGSGEPQGDPAPAAEPVTLPEDTTKVADVLEWVGSDPARAQAALDVETAKPEKDRRKTLVKTLAELIVAGD